MGEMGTVLVVTLMMTLLIDYTSAYVRSRMAHP